MRYLFSFGIATVVAFLCGCSGASNVAPFGASQAQGVADAVQPDTAAQTIFVSQESGGEILAFKAKAKGNAAPIRIISGGATGLTNPTGIAVAPDGRIGVGNVDNASGTVHAETFAKNASGNAAPLTAISCGGTTVPLGVAFDAQGNLYVTNGKRANDVTVFAPSDTGCVTGNRIIAGSNTTLSDPFGVRVDAAGKVYVANPGAASVVVFAAGASGNALPIAILAGVNTRLQLPTDIAIDQAGELVVTDSGANAVLVFAANANGNVAPVRSIAGAKTKLDEPNGIALDRMGNIYVVDPISSSVVVFKSTASGNVAPLRSISGPATGLYAPYKLAVR